MFGSRRAVRLDALLDESMTTVYILMVGGYEPWVEGVFSTYEAAAEAANSKENIRYDPVVTEWLVDFGEIQSWGWT